RPRLDRRAPRVAADAQAAQRRAVVAAILGEDLGPAGEQPGQDERLVVRLAAAVDEQRAPQVARRPAGQRLRQGGPPLAQHLRRDAAGALRLAPDGVDDAAVAVAEVAVEQLREEVEVTPPRAVEEVDALAAVELQDRVLALLHGPG